jgi:ABC-type transport system involved in multi-copper enzyme maturation permease subunit
MREVVWKDLVLNRNTLLLNGLIFVGTFGLLSAMSVDSPRVLAVFGGLMVAFAPVGIVTREDKSQAMALSCSLPVTRRTIVRARYALGLALVVPGVLLLLGTAAVVSDLIPPADLFRPSTLLLAYGLAILVLSLMFPLTLRMGATGLLVLLASFQVLGVVLLTIAQITRSNADQRILGAIVRFFANAASTLGEPVFYPVLVAALAAVLALSYRISVFLFERKDL